MTAEFFILFAEDVLTNSNKKKKLDIIKYFFDNFIMILFLDTVSPLPEFSLIEDNKVIYSLKILNNDYQKMSDYIIPAYNDIDKIYSLSNKLELLLVNTGPGSYTALRVGIAFLAGLSMSRKIKFIGISCADLIIYEIHKNAMQSTAILIQSSKDQNFFLKYNNTINGYNIKKIDHYHEDLNLENIRIILTNADKQHNYFNISKKICFKKISFKNIVFNNFDNILTLQQQEIVEPIYISNNNILN